MPIIPFNQEQNIRDQALFDAIRANNCDEVSRLLDAGANVQAVENSDGNTPLHLAVKLAEKNENKTIIDLLIEKGASKISYNARKETPLHLAVCDSMTDIFVVKMLLTNFDINAYRGLLHRAVLYGRGRIDVVEALLDVGVNVDTVTRSGSSKTALEVAASAGHLEVVRTLIARGATKKNAALHEATRSGHLAVAELLLDSGADINEVNSCPDILDSCRETSLHMVVRRAGVDFVKMFIAREADLTIMNEMGETPLDLAHSYFEERNPQRNLQSDRAFSEIIPCLTEAYVEQMLKKAASNMTFEPKTVEPLKAVKDELAKAFLTNENLISVSGSFLNLFSKEVEDEAAVRLAIEEHERKNRQTFLVQEANIDVSYTVIDNTGLFVKKDFQFNDPSFYDAKEICIDLTKFMEKRNRLDFFNEKNHAVLSFMVGELSKCRHLIKYEFKPPLSVVDTIGIKEKRALDALITENKRRADKYKSSLAEWISKICFLIGIWATRTRAKFGWIGALLTGLLALIAGGITGDFISFCRDKFLFWVGRDKLKVIRAAAAEQNKNPEVSGDVDIELSNSEKIAIRKGFESRNGIKEYTYSWFDYRTYLNYAYYVAGLQAGVHSILEPEDIEKITTPPKPR